MSPDLNFSNRPVRTRMPGGVAGAQLNGFPYADLANEDSANFSANAAVCARRHGPVRHGHCRARQSPQNLGEDGQFQVS